MTSSSPSNNTWVYDPLRGVYHHAQFDTLAFPDPSTGQWLYMSSSSFEKPPAAGEDGELGSTSQSHDPEPTGGMGEEGGREEGEVEDDVGWGGLMDPDELAKIENAKNKANKQRRNNVHMNIGGVQESDGIPTFDDPNLYAYPSQAAATEPETEKELGNHLLRLVVTATACPRVTVGQVAIIDAREEGIQIGRDKCEKGAPARIRLRELEVSKTHAVVYWDESGKKEKGNAGDIRSVCQGWWVVDLGSTHGTFLNDFGNDVEKEPTKINSATGQRLSEAKHSSKPFSVGHLSTITIGTTTFQAHIHSSWPCDACKLIGDNELFLDDGKVHGEGGAVSIPEQKTWDIALTSEQKRGNREARRKKEMASLKDVLLNRGQEMQSSLKETGSRGYVDRSAMRRQLHPKSPPQNHRLSSAPPSPGAIQPSMPPAPVRNKFAEDFLAMQGWQQGAGLGKDGTGRADHIEVHKRVGKRGLGAIGSVEDTGDWKQRGKMKRFEEVSRRH
ncbi:uncharacterized protein L203_102011 [Cryptococcus depauperatus CBS 7841]|uniref:Uncharacterized protein n=1 Tax=Cryptococcus depauperatus CBS 7841 TaxID=1295531 RepID=A0A1E3ITN3_9TREE|nr:hypothetical protein L203_01263 [Cryptococcus depauperatus CBS 7841]